MTEREVRRESLGTERTIITNEETRVAKLLLKVTHMLTTI